MCPIVKSELKLTRPGIFLSDIFTEVIYSKLEL